MLDGFKSPFKGIGSPFGKRRGGSVAPANTSSPVISGSPGVGQTLTSTTGTWTGTPGPTFSYQWKRGVTNVGTNANTYSPVSGDIASNITCVVTATNTAGSANATSNAIGPIVALPVNSVAPVISGTATVGQLLSSTGGTWTGEDSIAYQWKADGVAISGATGSTYTLAIAQAGASITCTVTATNTGGTTSATSNALSPVNASPVVSVAPSISGTTTAGQVLSVSNGTWLGYPASYSYAYQWKEDGANISGATSSTYTLQTEQAAKTITCTVTATNSTGSTPTTTSGVGPVSSSPVNSVLPAITGITQVGETLTCSTGTWYAYPVPTYTYQWRADGIDISGATSSTYLLTASEEGDTITCVVTATSALAPSGVTATASGVGPISAAANLAGTGERAMEDGYARLMEDGTTRKLESYSSDVLSSLVITPLSGGTTADFTVNCSATSGTLYAIVLASGSAAPINSEIEDYAVDFIADGSPPALWGTSFDLSSIEDWGPGISGLIQSTTYDFYMVVRLTPAVGDYSNVVTDDFTMVDGPPVLSNISVAAYSPTSMVIGVTTDDPTGTIKFAAFPSATSPTKSNILNGTGGALDYESKSVSGTGTYGVLMTGLTASTDYKGHAYAIDTATNESGISSSSLLATPASETSLFQVLNAGATTGTSISATLSSSTSQSDPFGGTNAISVSCDPGGVGKLCTVTRTQSAFVDGVMKVRFCVKKVAWASSQAWIRFGMQNVAAAGVCNLNFNLDDGTFAVLGANISNNTSVKLGGGWWFVSFDANLNTTGGADDINGSATIWLASLSSNNAITTSGTHTLALYDWRGSY